MKKTLLALALMMSVSVPAMAEQMINKADSADAKVDYMFHKGDTDHDNFISKTEYSLSANKMFVEADTNNDEKLSRDEVKAAKEKEHNNYAAAKGDSNKETER